MKKIIVLILMCFFIGGCYDYQELNDLSLVSGIGIDYNNEEYIVSFEIIESIKEGSSTTIKPKVVKGQDKELAEAFNKAMKNSNKKVYMEHVKVLIYSEELAKNGIIDSLDYIIRNTQINTNYKMVITKDIDEIFNVELENDVVSNVIVETIDYGINSKNADNLDIKASYIITDSKSISVPYVEIVDENVKIDKVALFKKDKMVNIEDDRMYEFLILDSSNSIFEDNDSSINVYKKEIKYEVKDDETIDIKISGYGKIVEINKELDLSKKETYKELEKIINEKIKDEVSNYIKEKLDDDIDLLGLKDLYYKKKKEKIDKVNFNVSVDIKVNQNGSLFGVLHE